jgi:hypothetical protein
MKNLKKPMLNLDYLIINELTKLKWKKTQLNNHLTYMLKKKPLMQQNMIKIGTFENKIQI